MNNSACYPANAHNGCTNELNNLSKLVGQLEELDNDVYACLRSFVKQIRPVSNVESLLAPHCLFFLLNKKNVSMSV